MRLMLNIRHIRAADADILRQFIIAYFAMQKARRRCHRLTRRARASFSPVLTHYCVTLYTGRLEFFDENT